MQKGQIVAVRICEDIYPRVHLITQIKITVYLGVSDILFH